MLQSHYSVIIAGGGPAGAATALSLARAGISCLLLDKSVPYQFKIGEGLPPAGKRMLNDLGLWDRFCEGPHLPSYGNESSWGDDTIFGNNFIHDPDGHGWHLDRAAFDALLREEASLKGAEVLMATELVDFGHKSDGGWTARVRIGNEIQETECSWLVDATGRSCKIARKLGFKRESFDSLTAFYTVFSQKQGWVDDEDSLTLIEAAPDGWWYTALLPRRKRVVAFLTDTKTAASTAAKSKEGFTQLLAQTRHIWAKLQAHEFENHHPPKSAPANSSRLQQFAGKDWLAVGDAATAFDPLSSQGILTSMYHGIKASKALIKALEGDVAALRSYEEAVEIVYQTYLTNRSTYYQFEQRWNQHPFWLKRHAEGQQFFNQRD
jgi:2-polyprenyl-6-methoxyphenol hydroxylase-like FAD-dependent oxidoreductase